MDVEWTLVNRAKNLVEDQLNKPVLQLPTIADNREPLLQFLRPGMRLLDVGANDRSLQNFLATRLNFQVEYKSHGYRSYPCS